MKIQRVDGGFKIARRAQERLNPWLPSQMVNARVADGHEPVCCCKDVWYAFRGLTFLERFERFERVCARVERLLRVPALEGLVHGVAVCAVFVGCGEDEVGFVVLEHLEMLASNRVYRKRKLSLRSTFRTFCGHFE